MGSLHYHLELVNQIGYKDTFDSLFSGFENSFNKCCYTKAKTRAFMKIWETLNNIEFWENKAFHDFDSLLNRYNDYNNRRNNALENYRKMIEPIAQQVNAGRGVPERIALYLQALDKINVVWQRCDKRTTPYVAHKKLVIPMRILNRKFSDLPLANSINDHLLQASFYYDNMYHLLKVYRKQYAIYAASFRYNYRVTERAIRILGLK